MTIWAPKLPESAKSKYEAIATAIGDDIAVGILKPGQRLPTQRELSKQLSVTIGTVGRAYALAEQRGLVSLEVGRGSFVRSIESRSFESRSNETGRVGNVIDLGLNLPPVSEHPELLAKSLILVSSSRKAGTLFGNAPVEAFEHHRIAAAKWMSDRISCSHEDILICSGTQNALVSSLACVTEPGDSVMVEELTFPGVIAAAKLLRLRLVPLKLDGHGIIPADLERASKHSRVLYCIPTNQNPTTTTMPKSRRKEIAKTSAKRGLTIIEDDVYGKLIENAPLPIATHAADQTILISSLAKTLSVGLRLAFVVVPPGLRGSMLSNMRAINFFPSPLLCEVATNWISGTIAIQLLTELQSMARRRQEIAREVVSLELIYGNPQGNHLWLNLPSVWTAETFVRAARENGVNLYSANAFSPGQTKHNSVRIALGAARNESELRVGLGVIERLITGETEKSSVSY